MTQARSQTQSSWGQEFEDILRGVAGAFLFGVPLLYTMEVWWIGSHIGPARMLVGLALTYLALIAINRTTGFRQQRGTSFWRSLSDSAEVLAIGLVVAALSLLLIRRLSSDMALDTALGLIALESIPFSIGVGIAGGLLGRAGDDDDEDAAQAATKDGEQSSESLWRETLADAGATALGAIIVAFSIAPTDEVPMIASALAPFELLVMVTASLIISYIIVFQAEFGNQNSRQNHRGLFQSPLSETVASYLIALVMSLIMLVFFKHLPIDAPFSQWLTYAITLGLPATIGGAAGRLAI